MTIKIDKKMCTGCGPSKQPPCMMICPGDLIYKDFSIKKAVLRNKADCWDCYSCVKVCPEGAINVILSYEISNRGASLKPDMTENDTIEWVLQDKQGKIITYRQSTKYLPLEPDAADERFTEIGEGI
jgi:adenylylsulfate reductase subunit B